MKILDIGPFQTPHIFETKRGTTNISQILQTGIFQGNAMEKPAYKLDL
jgi:hypothetical protein